MLKVRAGAEDAFARAVTLDPGFALGHAALALLGHECGAAVDVPGHSPTPSAAHTNAPTNASGPSSR